MKKSSRAVAQRPKGGGKEEKPASDGTAAAKVRPAARPAAATARTARGISASDQEQLFDKAAALFHQGSFSQAMEIFEKVAGGPLRPVAHAARTHILMCQRRLARQTEPPATAEDHYNWAIALLNRREVAPAERHLEAALSLTPQGDHIHYALALARGLRGDYGQAYASLKRAIELNPRNRTQARHDPDFAEFSQHPAIASLLISEKELGA